mmetsp:Transcript_23257/g.72721  ORF Transcript_23257/g.72721 Transcript_23257/m.72721 type:complete len:461 (+) Transcript_23257:687-2069(+)
MSAMKRVKWLLMACTSSSSRRARKFEGARQGRPHAGASLKPGERKGSRLRQSAPSTLLMHREMIGRPFCNLHLLILRGSGEPILFLSRMAQACAPRAPLATASRACGSLSRSQLPLRAPLATASRAGTGFPTSRSGPPHHHLLQRVAPTVMLPTTSPSAPGGRRGLKATAMYGDYPTKGKEFVAPPAFDSVVEGLLTKEQVESFFRDGYVIVEGLLSGDLLERVVDVKNRCKSAMPNTEFETLLLEAWSQHDVFREVATDSPVPRAAAQLTPSVARGDETLHVVKDAFFKFQGEGKVGCGWHVDDAFFWPADRDQGGADPGVNFWIALDEVTEDGGGMAIAPGSYGEDFLDCRDSIEDGGTCNMAVSFEEGNRRLEERVLRPVLQPGDAIVHTRFTFHRTDPFRPGAANADEGVARYSVRYMPSSAALKGVAGFNEEGAQFWKGERIGEADPSKFLKAKV